VDRGKAEKTDGGATESTDVGEGTQRGSRKRASRRESKKSSKAG